MPTNRLLFAASLAMLPCGLTASLAAESGGVCTHHPASAGAVGKRVAVIVGDGAYANGIPALANPTHDAEATSKAVAALGFETFVSTNADSASLQTCLDGAYAALPDADVAMFYYSGHGIQIKDENYLVATDAHSGDLAHGFVPVQLIVDAMQKQAKATLILLDACRNNPLADADGGHAGLSVSTGRGLVRANAPAAGTPASSSSGVVAGTPAAVQARGLLVAYATSPNAVAQDGTGDLSPFTGAFVKTVGTSGYSIQRVMGDVTKSVGEETKWAQTPWMKSSLTEELKLGGGETLTDAQSISDNHAAKSTTLLNSKGDKQAAIAEALKGLPATPDDAALKRFAKAYLALYSAVQSRDVVLPLPAGGHATVAVSTQDRVAVFRQNRDVTSGALQLWSVSQQKMVATPAATQLWQFRFSPHGKYLATYGNGPVGVFDGVDGSKVFDMRGGSFVTSADFSPDESRLMLVGSGLVVVDVATHKPTAVIKGGQLAGGKRGGMLAQALFAGNDAICYIVSSGLHGGVIGIYDLKQNKATHVRETKEAVTVLACDPTGRYMVRTFAVNSSEQGMEIWDTEKDEVRAVKAPIFNIMSLDPKGQYASVLAFAANAEGVYDLATGAMAHPPSIPDGFHVTGPRVHDASGALVNQDLAINPWRDWPDEGLYGPALVQKAMSGLTDAQRAEIARDRITFADVAKR